jgi:hypothetical protein
MQSGHVESFNRSFGMECLNARCSPGLRQVRSIMENWRRDYKGVRPIAHSMGIKAGRICAGEQRFLRRHGE